MKSKIGLWVAITNLIWMTAGCQPASNNGKAITPEAACPQGKSISAEDLAIRGSLGGSPGQTLEYSLNESLICSPSPSVSWSSASGKALGSGEHASVAYTKPGSYVIVAAVQDPASTSPDMMSFKTVVTTGLAVNGPQVGIAEIENHYDLVVPSGISITNASWSFGDGSPAESALNSIDHTHYAAGNYTVTVTVTLANGDTSVVTHAIQIVAANDTLTCVNQLAISGPNTSTSGSSVTLSVFLPSCLASRVSHVDWNFADGSPLGGGQTVNHTFQTPGTYHVGAAIYLGESTTPFATLYIDVTVTPVDGGGDPDPGGDGTVPPPNPNECQELGQARATTGELYTERQSCGVNGSRTDSYRDTVTQTCQLVGEIQKWVETSRSKQLVSQGACEGQSCEIPASALGGVDPASLGLQVIGGRYYLADGASKTFFSTTTPGGACSTVSQSRSCSNGALGGDTSYSNLTCHDGCADFGPHGTVKTGVVTGTENVPHACAFGETGIFDIFTLVSEQSCRDGQVSTTKTERGSLQTAGVCPVYAWTPTEAYSTCSADCGGTQSVQFICTDGQGHSVDLSRCAGEVPVITRVCDGNPDAVRRSENETVTEEAGQSTMCPANQIGVIVRLHDVTTTTTYACINHQVAQESQTRSEGPWREERYCRDYVPKRCSADSLSNTQAKGRYQWMLKCQERVPVIREFLANFESYENGQGTSAGLKLKDRFVYPTFMYHKNGREATWQAPTTPEASCDVREGIYVAAVCTASCSTPEQLILAQAQANGKLAYTPFITALQDDYKMVGTLQSQSSMSSKRVVKTAVDDWITELVDAEQTILTFTMRSGGVLRVTTNHPLLTKDGTMRLSADFKVGDSLVRLGGEPDSIVSIEAWQYYGKVYNLFVKSAELHKNVVVTNGYLNGTAYFQNDGAQHLNKRLFRGNLIRGVLD